MRLSVGLLLAVTLGTPPCKHLAQLPAAVDSFEPRERASAASLTTGQCAGIESAGDGFLLRCLARPKPAVPRRVDVARLSG